MWGQVEELPPFTVYFPDWMAGRHAEIMEMCEEWEVGGPVTRFAYRLELPGTGMHVDELHVYENGEWV